MSPAQHYLAAEQEMKRFIMWVLAPRLVPVAWTQPCDLTDPRTYGTRKGRGREEGYALVPTYQSRNKGDKNAELLRGDRHLPSSRSGFTHLIETCGNLD